MLVDWLEDDLNKITDDKFDKRSSVTSKGGRPYILSPRELTDSMIAYFRRCIINDYPFTVISLSQQLGMTRRGLLRLEKSSNKKFIPIIQKGKQMIESYLEMKCHLSQNPSCSIFILKNMGWR